VRLRHLPGRGLRGAKERSQARGGCPAATEVRARPLQQLAAPWHREPRRGPRDQHAINAASIKRSWWSRSAATLNSHVVCNSRLDEHRRRCRRSEEALRVASLPL